MPKEVTIKQKNTQIKDEKINSNKKNTIAIKTKKISTTQVKREEELRKAMRKLF